jgi:hypothetical protein
MGVKQPTAARRGLPAPRRREEPGLLAVVIVNHTRNGLYIYREGKKRIKLSSGKTMTAPIPNGRQTVMAEQQFVKSAERGSIAFELA